MKKYYIGLIVLAVLSVGLSIYVITLGAIGKQDRETENRARDIASDLNTYINSNRKIPNSLEETGVTNVPSTIRYNKKSDTQFEFCVTYKTDRNPYGGIDPWPATLMGGGYGYYDYSPDDYLYIDSAHKKGENCQTITPYISTYDPYDYNQYDTDDNSSTDYEYNLDQYCQPTNEYYETFKNYCVDGHYQYPTTPPPPPAGDQLLTN